jgi:hypothetical protein
MAAQTTPPAVASANATEPPYETAPQGQEPKKGDPILRTARGQRHDHGGANHGADHPEPPLGQRPSQAAAGTRSAPRYRLSSWNRNATKRARHTEAHSRTPKSKGSLAAASASLKFPLNRGNAALVCIQPRSRINTHADWPCLAASPSHRTDRQRDSRSMTACMRFSPHDRHSEVAR